jgi:hypothetical protein
MRLHDLADHLMPLSLFTGIETFCSYFNLFSGGGNRDRARFGRSLRLITVYTYFIVCGLVAAVYSLIFDSVIENNNMYLFAIIGYRFTPKNARLLSFNHVYAHFFRLYSD